MDEMLVAAVVVSGLDETVDEMLVAAVVEAWIVDGPNVVVTLFILSSIFRIASSLCINSFRSLAFVSSSRFVELKNLIATFEDFERLMFEGRVFTSKFH